jgi:uncharacterized protein YijF (DUF1287 family)
MKIEQGSGHERARRQRRVLWLLTLIALAVVLIFAAAQNSRGLRKIALYAPQAARGVLPSGIKRITIKDKVAAKIVAGAKAQIGTRYDANYETISYPGGDVDSSKGACTDVIIRALREVKIDLQQLMHEDMAENFSVYPHQWGLSKPDKNIDHRRVPNQMKFFARFGQTLTTAVNASTLKSWQPGDFVYWDMGNGLQHTGIVSDGLNPNGVPLVIHNGWICVEDDSLTRWKIIGHFRYPKRQS